MPLPKSENSNSSGMKFVVNCQEKLKNTGTTLGWLENIKRLTTLDNSKIGMSDRAILEGILNKKTNVVIKIGKKTEELVKELEVAKRLYDANVSGILNYYCYFECNDKIENYMNTSIYPNICQGEGDNMRILVMEHIPNWNFKLFKWTQNNIPLLKSCCKQVICTLLDAYLKTGFVHRDINLQNILLKKTNTKSISYAYISDRQDITTIISIQGYYTVLMDFELSEFYTDDNELRRFFIDIRDLINYIDRDLPIELNNVLIISRAIIDILTSIEQSNKPNIKATDILQIIPLIDNIEYRCDRSNIKKSNISYRNFVYGGNRK